MSNKWAYYVWEAVDQQTLNKFCAEDGVPKRPRYRWVHIWQACKLLNMTPKEIYQEGFRDFLELRTNCWHYRDIYHHVDGIIHPDAIVTYMGKAAFERLGNGLLKQLKRDGLPTEMDLALFSMVFDDPELFHKSVRRSVIDKNNRRRVLDALELPKHPYNGQQLRNMGIWTETDDVNWLSDDDIKEKGLLQP